MTSIETARLIERLQARVEELEYELQAMKAEEETQLAALMDHYDLTANEARIIRAMANARGGPMSRPAIWEKVGLEGDLRQIDWHIRRIRSKNKARLPIGTMYGIGYRLTAEVAKFVRDVMDGKVQSDQPRVSYFFENRKQPATQREVRS